MLATFLMVFAVPLICILAIGLGIWYERKKAIEKKGRKMKYIMFSLVGVLSFFGGLCLGEGMHLGYLIFGASGGPATLFPFALIIYALLFFLGLYLSKERSRGFVLKAFGISFLFLFLAFQSFMAYGAYEHYSAKYISVRTVTAPDDYVIVTEEDLNDYPSLKKAIEDAKSSEEGQAVLKVHPDEWERISDFLSEKGSHNIRVGDEYYEVGFMCA